MKKNRRDKYTFAPRFSDAGRSSRKTNWTFEQLEDRHMFSVSPLNDPYIDQQWHLNNTGQVVGDPIEQDVFGVPGEDANVFGAWNLGYSGQGVVVAVVDSGLQLDHPDLQANISTTLGYDALLDFEIGDFPDLPGFPLAGEANADSPINAHGTAVAGLIGAVGNNGIGGAGIAYNSTLVPIRLVDTGIDAASQLRAFQFENNQIDIYNHSWGPSDAVRVVGGPNGPLDPLLSALQNSAENGRDGLGNIHVWASGNGGAPSFISSEFLDTGIWDYAGYDGFVNSRHTIGVTGVDHDGFYSNVDGTATAYPEASAAVLVAAPTGSNVQELGNAAIVGSGLTTTDLYNPDFDPDNPVYDPNSPLYNPLTPTLEGYNAPSDGIQEPFDAIFDRFEDPSYTAQFNGTSASAPVASGVIALMLEANPDLSYRDVQNILVRSARQNAQFENMGDGLSQGTYSELFNNTWTVNQNEFFHTPDSLNGDIYLQNGTLDYLDLFNDNRDDIANNYIDSAVGSGVTVVYNPIIDPVATPLGTIDDLFPENDYVITSNMMDPNLFTNGAGYTVSLGRGLYGTGVGFGHGVIDAELAVRLAEQYTAYLPDEISWTTGKQQPGLQIGGEEVGATTQSNVVAPGVLESSGAITAIDPAYSETPTFPDANTFSFGQDFLPIVVPETLTTNPAEGFNSNMVVEWVELRLSAAIANVDELRITLVSPDGTHSELTNYFDLDVGVRTHQSPAAVDLVGAPGATPSPEWTFTTNRHWGEKSDNTVAIDPSTGEPYPDAPDRSWQLHFENFSVGDSINDYEVIFHGSPLNPDTQRIQGFVGVDEFRPDAKDVDQDGFDEEVIKDGIFNFDRYIQISEDIFNVSTIDPEDDSQLENAIFNRLNIPLINANNATTAVIQTEDPLNPGVFSQSLVGIASESLANGAVDFNRLGELDRAVDLTQETFAENAAVQLFREYRSGAVDATPYQEFVTGADGNYYFDVVPPVDTEFDIDLVFGEGLTDSHKSVFQEAVDIWESIIVDDLPDVHLGGDFYIDDLVISAAGVVADGPGGLLGFAGPDILRPGTFLPASGEMSFDVADLESLEANGELLAVILHEMAHVLGFGTIWTQLGLLENPSAGSPTPLDTRFLGQEATAEYNTLLGGGSEVSVPVENDAGPGSIDSHWRETVFDNELMTPFLNSGEANPLSRLTIAQFADLGYTVDYAAAESYSLPGAPVAAAAGGMIEIMNTTPQVLGLDALASSQSAPEDVVAYVVRVVDSQSREALEDQNAVEGYMANFQDEWRLTSDYFSLTDHEGRSPEFLTAVNPAAADPQGPNATAEFVEGVVMNIVTPGGNNALFDPLTSSSISALVGEMGSPTQEIQFLDDTGAPVRAYTPADPANMVTGMPLLTDVQGNTAIIISWDPSFTGGNAQQYVLLTPDPMNPMDPNAGLVVTDEADEIIYTLNPDGTITAIDADGNMFTITINGNGTHTIVDADGEVEQVNGILEIYDQTNNLVTVEVDLGGNFFFMSTTNLNINALFSPTLDTHELEVLANGPSLSPTYIFDPTLVYDVLVQADGAPTPYIDAATNARVRDDVRGINFLLDSGAAPAVEGRVFTDVNGDGVYSPAAGDVAKTGATVYIDVDQDGAYLPSFDLAVLTDSEGLYTLDLSLLDSPLAVDVKVVEQSGFDLVTPSSGTYELLVANVVGSTYDFVFEVSDGGVPNPDGTSGIMGVVFEDLDGNGARDPGEDGFGGLTVFLDTNEDGILDNDEVRTTTNTGGFYEFSELAVGPTSVAISVSLPFVQTTPFNDMNGNGTLEPGEGNFPVNVVGGVIATNVSFGVQSLAVRDYGDLGTVAGVTYATTIAQDGPSHAIVAGVKLGNVIDGEFDGQPNTDATGDDSTTLNDDDGVVIVDFGGDAWIDAGDTLTFDISVSGVGFMLNAWLDYNGDGDFDDAGEHVYVNQDLNPGEWRTGVTIDGAGAIALPEIVAPAGVTTTGPIGARFRWGEGDLLATGSANIGEVEDYLYNYDPNTQPQEGAVPGDYDESGLVDRDDYLLWRSSYGQTGAGLAADGNGDGIVDSADYSIWRDHLGESAAVESEGLSTRSAEQNTIESQMMNALGLEKVLQKIGDGTRARYVTVYRPIVTEASTLASTPSAGLVAQESVEPEYTPRFYASVASSLVIGSDSSGLVEQTLVDGAALAARASQLDLALALLHDTEEHEREDFEFVTNRSEEDSDEALAVALEEDLFAY